MAPLTNPRWERFAQALAKGKTATDAYAEAGFAPNRQNAARLTTNDDVKARLAELQNRAAAKTEITVAKLADMFLDDRKLAHEIKQPAAATAAANALGKLYGLMVDRSKSEVEHRYVLRAPTPSKTLDEWVQQTKPKAKPNGNGATKPLQ